MKEPISVHDPDLIKLSQGHSVYIFIERMS